MPGPGDHISGKIRFKVYEIIDNWQSIDGKSGGNCGVARFTHLCRAAVRTGIERAAGDVFLAVSGDV